MDASKYDYKFRWKPLDDQPTTYVNDFDKNCSINYNINDLLNDSIDVNTMNLQI